MYQVHTYQLRSTFNCYFPYGKGQFGNVNQLLLNIFLTISSIMVIIVSSVIQLKYSYNKMQDVLLKDIGRNAVRLNYVTFFSIKKILFYVAIAFVMSQILFD